MGGSEYTEMESENLGVLGSRAGRVASGALVTTQAQQGRSEQETVTKRQGQERKVLAW